MNQLFFVVTGLDGAAANTRYVTASCFEAVAAHYSEDGAAAAYGPIRSITLVGTVVELNRKPAGFNL